MSHLLLPLHSVCIFGRTSEPPADAEATANANTCTVGIQPSKSGLLRCFCDMSGGCAHPKILTKANTRASEELASHSARWQGRRNRI
jgi:hypothetical protein